MATVSSPSGTDDGVTAPRGDGPPERLGPYELLVEIASGGMATVHLARAVDHRGGPPLVAVKRPHRHLTTDKTFLAMLVDEARLASAIEHPNVVKVRELGFDGGVPFIVMDYVEGASLAELRRELTPLGRALDVRVAVRIALDALAGLHAAHQLRDEAGKPLHIVHRDVSPHNVLIGCDGRSHLTDFGIAHAEDRVQVTQTHEVKGKLAYLAPERVDKRRACTIQSDVFSMAVVLWECFAGRRLFRGEEAVDVLQEVVSGPIPSLRAIGVQVPGALDDVIMRGLSRDLAERHATAADLARDIERAAGPEQIGSHADVARLMEALFGARMAKRHERVGVAIGSTDLRHLLRESGLRPRDESSSADSTSGLVPADLAPPAPSTRYALGAELRGPGSSGGAGRRMALWTGAAIASGVAIGAVLTLELTSRASRVAGPPPSSSSLRPLASAPASTPSANVRHVTVRLPFLTTRVTFDGVDRELTPPSDVAVFDVDVQSGPRHRVTALALDGTRAEGYVRERDGAATADADGYAFLPAAEESPSDTHREPAPPGPHRRRAIGTLRDGFTKLK